MKVQLSGKEYVSNLESLGLKPMLSNIFFINYLRQMGVEGAHVEEGCWGGHTMLPHTFFYQLSVPDGGGGGPRRRGVGWGHVAEGGRQGWGRPPC
jgi:hypothetical protein